MTEACRATLRTVSIVSFAVGFLAVLLAGWQPAHADVSERQLWDQCLALQWLANPDGHKVGEQVVGAYMQKFGASREETLKNRSDMAATVKLAIEHNMMTYDEFAGIEERCHARTGFNGENVGPSMAKKFMKYHLFPQQFAADERAENARLAEAQRVKEANRCSVQMSAVNREMATMQGLLDNPRTTYQMTSGLNAICISMRNHALRLRTWGCGEDVANQVSQVAILALRHASARLDKDFPEENARLNCLAVSPQPIQYGE